MRTYCQPDTKLTSACTDGKGEHARHTYDRDRQSNCGKPTEHNCVETIGGEHFGADIFERSGVLNGLINRHFTHDARDRCDQNVRINARVHEQPPAKDAHAIVGKIIRHLAERMIDGDAGRRRRRPR